MWFSADLLCYFMCYLGKIIVLFYVLFGGFIGYEKQWICLFYMFDLYRFVFNILVFICLNILEISYVFWCLFCYIYLFKVSKLNDRCEKSYLRSEI